MSTIRGGWKSATRTFTSSSRHSAIKPESPYSVDIPRAVQPFLEKKQSVKGTLPVPREIFPARRQDKPSQAYLDAATTEPAKERTIEPDDPHADYNEWKYRMAEVRRQNLREGLLELYNRKQRIEQAMKQRSAAKQARRELILQQPEREDERLTRSSTPISSLQQKTTRRGELSELQIENQIARREQQIARRQQRRHFERIDALHSLYMNARQFITSEEQLNAVIEKVFPEGENEAWRNDHQPGENIWNLGRPQSIDSFANTVGRPEAHRWDIVQERLKRLGEQITGGKL